MCGPHSQSTIAAETAEPPLHVCVYSLYIESLSVCVCYYKPHFLACRQPFGRQSCYFIARMKCVGPKQKVVTHLAHLFNFCILSQSKVRSKGARKRTTPPYTEYSVSYIQDSRITSAIILRILLDKGTAGADILSNLLPMGTKNRHTTWMTHIICPLIRHSLRSNSGFTMSMIYITGMQCNATEGTRKQAAKR